MRKLRVLGVSQGSGIMLYPFHKNKKFEVIANIEIRKDFKTHGKKQWELNFEDIPFIQSGELPNFSDVDIILGSPNCGQFSVLSHSRTKKQVSKNMDASIQKFIDSIILYKPKVFALENLRDLLKLISIEDFKKLFPNYKILYHEGSVSQFGNSQLTRKRLFIIGVKRKVKGFKIKWFKDIFPVAELKHSGKLLEGTYPVENENYSGFCNIREFDDGDITIYAGKKIPILEIKKTWGNRLKGKKRWEIENGEKSFSSAPGVYRNLENDFPVTARKANRQYDHFGDMMTPRQLARIQGLPDSFQIWCEESKRTTCINKGRLSVTKGPPYEMGLWLLQTIIKNKF